MELYIIRHTAVDVPAGIAYGQTDVPLKSTFEEEAEIVKNNLKGKVFDQVWTSPLSRASKLATYCGYPDALRDDRLMEINFGKWEMLSWLEISEDSHSKQWMENWLSTTPPDGESFQMQYERVASFIEELKKNDYQSVCVFAHGGVIACANVYAGNTIMAESFSQIPVYGAIVRFEV